MHDRRTSLFCQTGLAERIERGERELIAAAARGAHDRTANGRGFLIPVAGGPASFADDDSPYNKVVGVGFGGVPTDAELDEIERAYAAYGAPVQVELPHLADPDIGLLLTARGYRLESFENVLGVALADGYHVAEPDTQGVPWREEFPRDTYLAAERDAASTGIARYAAVREGVIAGGAGLRTTEDGIAQFAGAATAPAHRRNGIQSALLSARLADAAAAGCDVAVITVQPGSKSQQNSQRSGFDLLYTRAVLVKQP